MQISNLIYNPNIWSRTGQIFQMKTKTMKFLMFGSDLRPSLAQIKIFRWVKGFKSEKALNQAWFHIDFTINSNPIVVNFYFASTYKSSLIYFIEI